MNNDLHIVSFNVPWPANYGGVMDVFYRLRALSRAGLRIHLHCYTYGRPAAPELEALCAEVHYYRRDMSPLRQLDSRPFIVSSRCNKELKKRLLQDRYPILLEGLHCCSLLEDESLLQGRTVMVRAHNIEADYYSRLAHSERHLLRRAYLALDAAKIKRYEPVLQRAAAVFAISEADRLGLLQMGCREVRLVTGGHPYDQVTASAGRGNYALYHGQLSVAENIRAVEWLITNVFSGSDHRLVVAGLNPAASLRRLVERHPNVSLVDSPDDHAMQRLVADAQVNILRTDQPTGMKIKLLHALFCGRHCLVNSPMVAGTGLGDLCCVADTAEAMRSELNRLMQTDFTDADASLRADRLSPYITANAVRPILDFVSAAEN
ncbi:MAG: glycosyltransferase [Bacteroidales bacterium]|nr:glycosyltransferase [Bacteroidales bacterium]